MHKTVLSSEGLLVNLLQRARELAREGFDLYTTPALRFFLYNLLGKDDLERENRFTPGLIASNFTRLDDSDIFISAKYWTDNSDKVLADLSRRLMKRELYAVELQDESFPAKRIDDLIIRAQSLLEVTPDETKYFVFTNSISNTAYESNASEVKILLKDGSIADISSVSDMFDHRFISERITKHFLCYPKECR
jgi:uncharacterized protein